MLDDDYYFDPDEYVARSQDDYDRRVRTYEVQGMSRSDAQGIVDGEDMQKGGQGVKLRRYDSKFDPPVHPDDQTTG